MSIRPFYLALFVSVLLLAGFLQQAMVEGVLAPPLDDSLIHFQYATAIAQGHPFEYWPGDGWSSGATSLIWPFLLAPGVLLGLHGLNLYFWALLLGCGALAGAATLVGQFYEREGGSRLVGMAAILFCGPLLWGIYSGMEIGMVALGLAGVLDGFSRIQHGEKTRALPLYLALLALVRPEGLFVGGWTLLLLFWERRRLPWLETAAVLLGLAQPILNRIGTGLWVGSSVLAKQNPRMPQVADVSTLGFLGKELIGTGYGSYFFGPLGVFLLGLLALGILKLLEKRESMALWLLGAWGLPMVGIALTVPVALNHDRYLMPGLIPMMAGVLIGVKFLGEKLEKRLDLVMIGWLLLGAFGWVRELADSTSDIRTQHVAAAHWIQEHTHPDTRIAVNDAGFVPELAERPVLDMEGIVTPAALPYAMAGDGGRLALLRKERPKLLAVFSDWYGALFQAGAVEVLWSATLAKRTSSGGNELVIGKPNWEVIDGGERPPQLRDGEVVWDCVDVGDPDSEEAHAYAFSESRLEAGRNNIIFYGLMGDGSMLLDAVRRHYQEFSFELSSGIGDGAGRLVVRLAPMSAPVVLDLLLGDKAVTWKIPAVSTGRWEEISLPLTERPSRLKVKVVVETAAPGVGGGLAAGRWWWVGGTALPDGKP